MTLKQLRMLGLIGAAIGLVFCVMAAAKRMSGIGALAYEILAIKSEKKWDKATGFGRKAAIGESSHQAGPFTMTRDDAPYSFDWRVMDGGEKNYKFRIVLFSEGGVVNWIQTGSNAGIARTPGLNYTPIPLLTSRISQGDRYMFIAKITDDKGKIITSPSKLFVHRKVLMEGDNVYLDILRSRMFIVGLFMVIAGLSTVFAAKPLPRLAPSDR